MVVQHNLTAMNSNRMLGLTTASQAKSTEKLSSGYKINRAADDAAGLSISEKMRKQIRGLSQASLNAQDGISAVQTAEGALTEVHDMLQRMNELAVKASNGTMSENDRSYVQNEIDQLVTEIDRVSETTKFNETYLLKGKDVTTTEEIPASVEVEYRSNITGKTVATWGSGTAYATKEGQSVQITAGNFKDFIEVVDQKHATAGAGNTLYKNIGESKTFTAEEAKKLITVNPAGTTVTPDANFTTNNGYLVTDAFGQKVNSFENAFENLTASSVTSAAATTDVDLGAGATLIDGNFEIGGAATTGATTHGDLKDAIEAGTLTKTGGVALSADEMTKLKKSIGYVEASASLKAGYTITKELTLEEQYVEATEEDIINATTYDEDGNATGITGIYSDTRGTAAEVADVEYSSAATIKIKDGYEIYTAAPVDIQYGSQIPSVKLTEEDLLVTANNYITLESDLLLNVDGDTVSATELGKFFNEDGSYKGGLYKKNNSGVSTEIGAEQIDDYVKWNHTAASTVEKVTSEALRLSLQVGADTTEENKISVDIESMSAKSLGVDGLKVDGADSTNADAAVDTIAAAIEKVSAQRSALGAVQNRLEHTINNLDNVVENTTAAESQIRDTDMASEMVKYSNNNILAQAGQSMLAQANQSNQGVLSLLG